MPNESLIDEQINQFVEKQGIRVSEQARKVIQDLFDAVLLDPHPLWRERNVDPNKAFYLYVRQIPALLQNLVADERIERIITTWDIIHWLEPRLNTFCPWDYDPEPPQSSDSSNRSINSRNLPFGYQGGDPSSQDNLLFGLSNSDE